MAPVVLTKLTKMNVNEVKDKVQKEAATAWWNSGAKGTLELPTGAGKTRVGVMVAARRAKKFDLDYRILILTPTELLRDNAWVSEFHKWGEEDVLTECTTILCIQTAYKMMNQVWDLVIGDEIHNYLSDEYKQFFYNNECKEILGLSAKVNDGLDVLNGIAPICYSMSLEEARLLGIVSDYKVFNIPVTLTDTRMEEYEKITASINANRHFFGGSYNDIPFHVKKYIAARKELLYNAEEKIEVVKLISDMFPDRLALIFGKSIPFIERIASELGSSCLTIHSHNPKKYNKKVLEALEDSNTNITRVAAVKSLNEGINVPSVSLIVRVNFDSKEKNWIQQAGRGLRVEAGKTALIFNIYIANTKDTDWLEESFGTVKDITWFKSIEEFKNYFNGSRQSTFENKVQNTNSRGTIRFIRR